MTIFFFLASVPGFSQKARVDIDKAGLPAQVIHSSAPALLAQKLTKSYNTELEKVKAIFRWITENIEYGIKPPAMRTKKSQVIFIGEDDTAALKPLDERVAESVLERKRAVCDGYARLFKTLCGYAGIRSELITGYARTGAYPTNQRFRSNHTWNAVMIDGVWKLVDVTWASGYVSWWGDLFVRHFNEEYFLTPPEQFIQDHYPDEIHWTLMANPPVMAEFRQSPYKQRTFLKYSITNYLPAKGLIEANPGDTIRLELETSDAQRDKQIGADPFLDTAVYSTDKSALLVPAAAYPDRTIYTYPVVSTAVDWLYILYNGDVVLRYRLLVKNKTELANSEFK